jgi:hypothetical protein
MKTVSIFGAKMVVAAIMVAAPLSLRQSPDMGVAVLLNVAEAVIGRPLTPMSVAGVHRRVHRRAYRRCATGVTCY